jgi:hypothetical protein
LEWKTNWLMHAVNDKRQTTHGSGHVGDDWATKTISEPWRHTRMGMSRLKSEPGGWKLYEPRATTEFLRY